MKNACLLLKLNHSSSHSSMLLNLYTHKVLLKKFQKKVPKVCLKKPEKYLKKSLKIPKNTKKALAKYPESTGKIL